MDKNVSEQVCDIMDKTNSRWKVGLIQQVVSDSIIKDITNMYIYAKKG